MNKQEQAIIAALETVEEDSVVFEYSEEFLLDLMAELLRDKEFALQFINHIKPEYFKERKLFAHFFILIRDYFNQFRDVPHTKENLFDHLIDFRKKHKAIEINEMIIKLIQGIFEKNPDGTYVYKTNKEFTHVKVNGFIRLAAAKIAFKEGYRKLVKTEDYDAVQGILQNLPTSTIQVPFDEWMDQLFEEETKGETAHYLSLNKLKLWEEVTQGLQKGMYLVSADTSVGKTNMLCNLLVDVLESNQDCCCLYFSLDDPADTVIKRLVSIMTDYKITIPKHDRPIIYKLPEQYEKMKQAHSQIKQWHQDKRLLIQDINTIQTLEQIESKIQQHQDTKIVVLIDGIYNTVVHQKGGIREENIARANKIKLLSDKYLIPVVGTGELRKQSKKEQEQAYTPTLNDQMESGKYKYNSSVCVNLYPESPAIFNSGDPWYNLICDFQKNKITGTRKSLLLRQQRGCAGLQEDGIVNG